jgi:hypothetical protein
MAIVASLDECGPIFQGNWRIVYLRTSIVLFCRPHIDAAGRDVLRDDSKLVTKSAHEIEDGPLGSSGTADL